MNEGLSFFYVFYHKLLLHSKDFLQLKCDTQSSQQNTKISLKKHSLIMHKIYFTIYRFVRESFISLYLNSKSNMQGLDGPIVLERKLLRSSLSGYR